MSIWPGNRLTLADWYDKFIPMKAGARTRAKIACSIESRLLVRVERMRAVTGESRSAVINRALAKLTSEELSAARAQRYVQAYREAPETATAVATARSLAERALANLAWEDS
jgi:phosphoribosylformylglycinamidine (FGAM) synthase PurS component